MVSVFGIGVLALVGLVAGLLTILDYLRYIPDLLVIMQNPSRIQDIPYSIVETYQFKQFWRPIVKDEEVVVVIPAKDVADLRDDHFKYDHIGLQELIDELRSNFRNLDITFISDDQFGEAHKDKSIICVAGPISNRITYELLYQNDVPFKFDKMSTGQPTHTIISDSGDVRLEPETYYNEETQQREIRRDHGIITRTSSPYDANRMIVNVSGCFGEGTHAGFQLLTRPSALRQLRSEGGSNFQALYTVPVDDEGVLKTPELLVNSTDIDGSDESIVKL